MFLLESPWPILVVGILVEAILAVILLQTGRGILLFVMIGVATLVLAALGIERLVVTDRERVVQTLDAAAQALKANDRKALGALIAPDAAEVHSRADWAFNAVRFRNVSVNTRPGDVEINRHTSPPTATVTVRGWVSGRGGVVGEAVEGDSPYEVDVKLRLEPEGWRFIGCSAPRTIGGHKPVR